MQNVDNSSPSICDASVKQKDLKVNYGETVHLSCPIHLNDLSEATSKYGSLKWFFYPDERSRYRRNNLLSGVFEVTNRRDKYALTTDNGLVILGTTDRESGRYECKLGTLPLIRYEIFVDSSKYFSLSTSHVSKVTFLVPFETFSVLFSSLSVLLYLYSYFLTFEFRSTFSAPSALFL
jgi:hypothetical protein